jgi:bacterioferritin-associated ferredoxin
VYVCICNQVTDREIHGAARLGISTLDELADALGVGTCCGRCKECAHNVLQEGVAAAALVPVPIPIKIHARLESQACSTSNSHAIMDVRGPEVANDQRESLVA